MTSPASETKQATVSNAVPVFDTTVLTELLRTATVEQDYTLDLKPAVSDDTTADDALTFTLADEPTGMTVPNGVITWRPTREQLGSHTVKVTVTDEGGGEAEQQININVVALVPEAPVLTATATTGLQKIKLTWTVPNDGGSDITGYRLEKSDDGSDGSWSTLAGGQHVDSNKPRQTPQD